MRKFHEHVKTENDWEEFYNLYTIAAQTSMDGSFTTIKYTARARFFVTDAKVWLQFLALFTLSLLP